jgi:hypothetical protein
MWSKVGTVFLSKLYRAALILLGGCAPSTPVPVNQPAKEEQLAVISPTFLPFFKAHGIECHQQGDWIVFPNRSVKAMGLVGNEFNPRPEAYSAQLDFQLRLDSGRTLIESFAGVGKTRESAVKDAVENFIRTSFHVILAAFFDAPNDQVTIEHWNIGGKDHQIIVAPLGMRGTSPNPSKSPQGLFKQIEEKLLSKQLDPGIHWLRVYYGQFNNRGIELEVLLDNETWDEMQKELATIDWPKGKEFFSLRVFMVIREG